MSEKALLFEALFDEILEVVQSTGNRDEKLLQICQVLEGNVAEYDWVGFYLTAPSGNETVLGPFVGAPTEHIRIPFGRGMCGVSAQARTTRISQDVTEEDEYLSCSPNVQSEIVVPILKDDKVLGVLDIDSHTPAPFTEEDKKFLERVCEQVSELF